MEVEEEIAGIEVPRLSAIDIWALPGPAEDVVENDVEGNWSVLAVEEGIDGELNGLKTSYLLSRTLRAQGQYAPAQRQNKQRRSRAS